MEEFIFRLKFWAKTDDDHEPDTLVYTQYAEAKSPVKISVAIPELSQNMKEHGFVKVDYVTVEVFQRVA